MSGFIHKFARTRDDLAADFPRLAGALTDNGTLWISWPKRASGMETDLTENIVREIGLKEGWWMSKCARSTRCGRA